MTIQSSDFFLVSNGGSKKCKAVNLKDQDGNVLVNRGQKSFKLDLKVISENLVDTDLMLVNRDGVSYKVTGAEVKKLFPSGPAGATDPIIAEGVNSITLESNKNLNTFTAGTNLIMIDDTGNTASYTPTTSKIIGNTVTTPVSAGWTEKSIDASSYNKRCAVVGKGMYKDRAVLFEYTPDSTKRSMYTKNKGEKFRDCNFPKETGGVMYPMGGCFIENQNMFICNYSGNDASSAGVMYRSIDGGESFTRLGYTTTNWGYPNMVAGPDGALAWVGQGTNKTSYYTDGNRITQTNLPHQIGEAGWGLGYFWVWTHSTQSNEKKLWRSQNGTAWSIAPGGSNLPVLGVLIGTDNVIMSVTASSTSISYDGECFKTYSNTGNPPVLNLGSKGHYSWFADGKFYINNAPAMGVGGAYRFVWSVDGIDWFDSTLGTTDRFNSIHGNEEWLLMLSSNGNNYSYGLVNDVLTQITQVLTFEESNIDFKFLKKGDKCNRGGYISDITGNQLTIFGGTKYNENDLLLGPPKSGTGIFESANNNVCNLKPCTSNNQWISKDNKEGKNFYAIPESGRLSADRAVLVEDYGVMETRAIQSPPEEVNGYYPLYRNQKLAELIGDGTFHTHVLDGVTYYMPQGDNITSYHGNYLSY